MLLKKENIPALLTALGESYDVFVPADFDGNSKFAPYSQNVEARFDLQNTKLPPKDLLFPATEKMYRWKLVGDELSIEKEATETKPFVLFGIRPCDVLSIDRLDDVFLTKGYIDTQYQAKRDALLMVSIACTEAAETCFCDSMGGSPTNAPNADVMLRDSGDDSYVVFPQTEKGEAAVATWQAFTTPDAAGGNIAEIPEVTCELAVNMDGIAEYLPSLFEDEMWEEISAPCLTCGTCTFVCPTCHCFDISQERKAEEGARFRCWDSCMFTDYTLMAGNHNPRQNKAQRVRQRFMHKLCFFEQRYGSPLCVGCGRCLLECPAAVDITRIVDYVNLRKAEANEPA